MMIEWENTGTFKRHMRDMNSFRRAHSRIAPRELLKKAREFPVPPNDANPCPADPPCYLTDFHGNVIIVPMWEMAMPENAQN
jgi:hypothetical protein